jgi:hypothetical protein
MFLAILAAAAATTPTPGVIKTYSDWTIGCDNARNCQAVALMPEDDISGSTMVLARGPAPDARPDIRINIQNGVAGSLRLDGRPIRARVRSEDGLVRVAPGEELALIESIRNGQQLEVLDRQGRSIGVVSLKGLMAALLHMDDQQKRVGLRSALARPGRIPDSDVEAPPPIPVIIRPKAPKTLPRKLGAADIARESGPLGCEPGQESGNDITHVRLDARTTLALFPFPCGNGAYNYFFSALLIDERGKVRPAEFDRSGAMGDKAHELVNADWSASERLLSAYSKGRGLGDCGVMQRYAWDGRRFRLVRQSEMLECRGSADFIQTWVAEVR